MRCTDCSKLVKPIVAMDIDGTLGQYHSHFLDFLDQWTGVTAVGPRYDGSVEFKEWCAVAYGITIAEYRQAKLAYRQGGLKRSMPPYEDATELCRAIRSAGAELWVTTTRPYLRLDNVDPDTREWLRRQGITYDGLLYDELKYTRLSEIVDKERVVAIVDDLPEMVQAANEQFGEAIAIHRVNEYNQPYGGWTEDSLGGICGRVLPRIINWRHTHDRSNRSS